MCAIDIKNYPFDEQNCHLLFGAWSYQTTKMNMSNTNETINRDSYTQNGEWQIMKTTVGRGEFYYAANDKERFAFVDFSIYLRRRHTFYVVNVIVPSIMTSVLLLSIFFCTPAQKVQIGVVVLLSFRIFLLNVAGNIPKTSDHVPLLGGVAVLLSSAVIVCHTFDNQCSTFILIYIIYIHISIIVRPKTGV